MSERLVWKPDKPEDEPVATIRTARGERILTRENTTLFTFLGKLAIYNHIYFCDIKEEEIDESFYIFSFTEGYKALEKYVRQHNYPAYINQTEVTSTDQNAYLSASLYDIGRADEITEGWE